VILSRAEREVALMFCRGLTDKEIADRLFRSYHTVSTRKRTIYQKLGVSKDTELLWWMIFERLGKEFSLNLIREKGIENI
jgi:DNA-binding CsgD family transcriptional regulator